MPDPQRPADRRPLAGRRGRGIVATLTGAVVLTGLCGAVLTSSAAPGRLAAAAAPPPAPAALMRGGGQPVRDSSASATPPVAQAPQPQMEQPQASAQSPQPQPQPSPTVPPQPAPTTPKLLHDTINLRDESAAHGSGPALSADSGILVDVDRHAILWQRNPHLPHAPASTTKVLTSMVVLENVSPAAQVTVTPDALTQASDETVMGLQAGEKLSVSELLTGMLLVSGNDAATALAVDTMGMDRFV